jgi:cysteine sulfinate desulfinase
VAQCRDRGQIVFTHGATSALNLLAYGLEHLFNPGDEIVISALEHHANLLPWQQLAKRRA